MEEFEAQLHLRNSKNEGQKIWFRWRKQIKVHIFQYPFVLETSCNEQRVSDTEIIDY
jgi:hypothetical protein